MACKKQGAKNRVIVIQKEKRPGCNDPVFCTLLFATHILDLIFSGSQTDRCFQNKNMGVQIFKTS